MLTVIYDLNTAEINVPTEEYGQEYAYHVCSLLMYEIADVLMYLTHQSYTNGEFECKIVNQRFPKYRILIMRINESKSLNYGI